MPLTRRDFCQSAISAPAIAVFLDALSEPASGETQVAAPKANYLLRYMVRSETAEQQTIGLIAHCRENHIPEVLLFNADHSVGWTLPTLDEARERAKVLRPVVRRLAVAR